MPGNKFNGYTDLGVGIGLRIPHYKEILSRTPEIDWFEIISENFMSASGRPLEILSSVLESYPVIQHGVSLYFGDLEPFDKQKLNQLKALVKRTKTPYLSDHLCWGSYGGIYSHDLLPLPYTKEAVKNTASRIKYVEDFLEIPICVENVSSYIEYTDSTMTEWQFLSEVVEMADCGILLDVNNIYVSAFNHEFDSQNYLDNIPLDRVSQIHVAGPLAQEDYLLDTHDHPPSPEVWQLYRKVIEKVGPINTLLEWDNNIPSFEEVKREAMKASSIIAEVSAAKEKGASNV